MLTVSTGSKTRGGRRWPTVFGACPTLTSSVPYRTLSWGASAGDGREMYDVSGALPALDGETEWDGLHLQRKASVISFTPEHSLPTRWISSVSTRKRGDPTASMTSTTPRMRWYGSASPDQAASCAAG
ncbi:MAG: hypothetical protein U0452_09920 [Anaerolineae bacterium]